MGGPNRHAKHSVQIRSPLPSRLHQGPQNTRTTTKIIERSSLGSPGAPSRIEGHEAHEDARVNAPWGRSIAGRFPLMPWAWRRGLHHGGG